LILIALILIVSPQDFSPGESWQFRDYATADTVLTFSPENDGRLVSISGLSLSSTTRNDVLDHLAQLTLKSYDPDRFLILGRDVVFQTTPNGCAAACVIMILHRLGFPVERDESLFRLDPEGGPVALLEVVNYFEQDWGIQAKGFRGTAHNIAYKPSPIMLHVDEHHYVVLSSLTKHGALILDPAMGRVFWPREMLDSRWNGVYLEVTK